MRAIYTYSAESLVGPMGYHFMVVTGSLELLVILSLKKKQNVSSNI